MCVLKYVLTIDVNKEGMGQVLVQSLSSVHKTQTKVPVLDPQQQGGNMESKHAL